MVAARRYATARTRAVVAAATSRTTSVGARRTSAAAAAPTPARRASNAMRWSPPNAWVTTRAARTAGARSSTTAIALRGRPRPPRSAGPAPLMATVAAPTTATVVHTAAVTVTGGPPRSVRRA